MSGIFKPPTNHIPQVSDLTVGACFDVRDEYGCFCAAKIVKVNADKIFVHYVDWPSKYDVWINKSEINRIANYGEFTSRDLDDHGYKENDHVMVYFNKKWHLAFVSQKKYAQIQVQFENKNQYWYPCGCFHVQRIKKIKSVNKNPKKIKLSNEPPQKEQSKEVEKDNSIRLNITYKFNEFNDALRTIVNQCLNNKENILPANVDISTVVSTTETKGVEAVDVTLNKQKTCAVCYEHPRDTVILSCYHVCLCSKCSTKFGPAGIKTCPVCRTTILEIKPIFFP